MDYLSRLNSARDAYNLVGISKVNILTRAREGLKARYPSIDEWDAFLYDGAWAITVSVLETRSVNATVVNGVFSDVCDRLNGASG